MGIETNLVMQKRTHHRSASPAPPGVAAAGGHPLGQPLAPLWYTLEGDVRHRPFQSETDEFITLARLLVLAVFFLKFLYLW